MPITNLVSLAFPTPFWSCDYLGTAVMDLSTKFGTNNCTKSADIDIYQYLPTSWLFMVSEIVSLMGNEE